MSFFHSSILVLAALVAGFTLSTQPYITSSSWWIFGCLSSLFLFHAPSSIAYVGGLGLAIYIMSVFPTLVSLVCHCDKGKVLTVGLLTVTIFLLASVWVVAYNFVPGGTLAREKNDFILITAMVFLGMLFNFFQPLLFLVFPDVINSFLIRLSRVRSPGKSETEFLIYGIQTKIWVSVVAKEKYFS